MLLLDSFFNYFLNVFGIPAIPTNALLIPLFALALVAFGGRSIQLKTYQLMAFIFLVSGFLMGFIIIEGTSWMKLGALSTGMISLLIGVSLGRFKDSDRHISNIGLLIGGIYCVVCAIATLRLMPAFFPVIDAIGYSSKGTLIVRPEVTIDQNFQIFYLFPVILCFTKKQSYKEIFIAIILVGLAVFSLVKLQTRSGILLIALGLASAFIMAISTKHKKPVLLLIGAIFFLLVAMLNLDSIIKISSGLIVRFTEDDLGGAWGRLFSAEYLFQKLIDVRWWLPKGDAIFANAYGDVPHFNPTAIFLEAGLVGLIGWCMLSLGPLIKGGFSIFKKRMKNHHAIYLGAFISMVASLTLNAPLFEHVWVWVGLLIGATSQTIKKRTSVSQKRLIK